MLGTDMVLLLVILQILILVALVGDLISHLVDWRHRR